MALTTFVPSLTVSNMERSIRFYEDALGFVVTFAMPGPDGAPVHAGLENGTASLMLGVPMTESAPLADRSSPGQGVNLYVGVAASDDIDALFERAKRAGATVVQEPTDEFWGDRDWSVADPDGYVITVGKQMRIMSPDEMIEASKSLLPA